MAPKMAGSPWASPDFPGVQFLFITFVYHISKEQFHSIKGKIKSNFTYHETEAKTRCSCKPVTTIALSRSCRDFCYAPGSSTFLA